MVRKLILPFLLAVLLMVPVWSLAEEQLIDEINYHGPYSRLKNNM